MSEQEACGNKVIDELSTRNVGKKFLSHESDGNITEKELREEQAIMNEVLKESRTACEGLDVTIDYQTIPGLRFDPEKEEITPFSAPSFNISIKPATNKGGIEL